METIQACVNQRLLSKADRLFTGTLNGRIIELLQNARRAGATKVAITNEGGLVTVKDNGQGIGDFAKLLDLGGSGWNEACEESEDPAGVGIFCLAPREVTIRSRGKMANITKMAGPLHQQRCSRTRSRFEKALSCGFRMSRGNHPGWTSTPFSVVCR